jgi:hypothetical protein
MEKAQNEIKTHVPTPQAPRVEYDLPPTKWPSYIDIVAEMEGHKQKPAEDMEPNAVKNRYEKLVALYPEAKGQLDLALKATDEKIEGVDADTV